MNGTTHTPWQSRHEELATWTMAHMLNRPDRLVTWINGGWLAATDDIQRRILNHFRHELQVVLYSTSEAGTCKWCCLDFDNHDELPGVAQRNMDVATGLLNILTELGIVSILEDSDGQGGLHLWILFAEPIPSEQAYCFARWIISDYPDDDIEANPKQRHGGKIGNGVRMPGRHHKRDHNSRIWGDAAWLDVDESVELLLCTVPNDPSVVELMGDFDPDPKPTPNPTDAYRPKTVTTYTGDNDITRAEAHIETTATWPELLIAHGWKPAGRNGDAWTRPGKDFGISATLSPEHGTLYVFSDVVNGLPPRKSYGKWRFWTHANGFGDQQLEAAKAYFAGGAT